MISVIFFSRHFAAPEILISVYEGYGTLKLQAEKC